MHGCEANRMRVLVSLLGVLILGLPAGCSSAYRREHTSLAMTSRQVQEVLARQPLSFEAAHQPEDAAADFIAQGMNYTLLLTSSTTRLQLHPPHARQASLDLEFVDAVKSARLTGTDRLARRNNYFLGNDPRAWRANVPQYARVERREIYPGVSVVFYGQQQQLEYDLVVTPHADPRQIRLVCKGAEQLTIDAQGDLLLTLAGEQVRMHKPIVYQETNRVRRPIAGSYVLYDGDQIGFELGAYDPEQTLIIDPVVNYSTFFGGNNTDIGYGIAVDRQGNVYVTGQTSSPNFPIKNAFENTLAGASDAFVMKLSASGTTVLFATYLGGRNAGDKGAAIAVDTAGNIYLTGETNSINFPVVNAAQPNYRGNTDAFVAKLNIEGNTLLYSTFLGGTLLDAAFSIALDRFDNAYITGLTESTNLMTRNALQPVLRGQRDAFVARYDPDGVLLYATYLGGDASPLTGRDEEAGYSIAVDVLQNVYVTGFTSSSSFPTFNALQPNFGGLEDAFITKLNPQGTALIYSTFLGGMRADNARGLAVDALGQALVTGYTFSNDFPRVNALQAAYGGNTDAFVAKLNATGTALIYSTFLGGDGEENTGLISDPTPSGAIAVDALGNAYVTGKTKSANFPVAHAVQASLRGDSDAFLAKLDPVGAELLYSTYLGSTFTGNTGFEERGLSLALDSLGNVFLTGQMLKSDFPTVLPVQASYGGGLSDAFISKISAPDLVTIAPVSAASFNGAALAPASIVTAFGNNLASGTETAMGLPLPSTLLGTSVTVRDKNGVERPAPLFFVSPSQVNFQLPSDTPTGRATIIITNAQGTNVRANVLVTTVAPGLFTASATGQGVAAAVVLRIQEDGTMSFEPVARLNEQGRVVAAPIELGPETDQVFLILFGTGLRQRAALDRIMARIGDIEVPVLYAGAQGSFVGQDQINLPLPRSLAGRGELLVTMTIEGMITNPVSINVR